MTSDPHLLDLAAAEQIPLLALPGTDGTTWIPPVDSLVALSQAAATVHA